MEGNMNTGFSGDEASWVLGLPAQRTVGASRAHQQSITQQSERAPVVGSYLAPNYVVDVIVVDAGEPKVRENSVTLSCKPNRCERKGIGEKIQSYLQVLGRFPANFRDHSCLGVILSAEGTISSPRMNILGSAVLYEGPYEIVKLSGFFFVPNDGQVQLSGSLKLTFCNSDGGVLGGPVVGSLTAAASLQVAVLTFIHDA